MFDRMLRKTFSWAEETWALEWTQPESAALRPFIDA